MPRDSSPPPPRFIEPIHSSPYPPARRRTYYRGSRRRQDPPRGRRAEESRRRRIDVRGTGSRRSVRPRLPERDRSGRALRVDRRRRRRANTPSSPAWPRRACTIRSSRKPRPSSPRIPATRKPTPPATAWRARSSSSTTRRRPPPSSRSSLPRRNFEFESEVAFRLGQCQLETGDCAKAEASFQRALEGAKDYLAAPARWLLGEAQLRCERYDAAERSYQAVLARDAQSEYADDALAGLAWCAFKSRKFDAASERAQDFSSASRRATAPTSSASSSGRPSSSSSGPSPRSAAYASVGRGAWTDGALRGAGFACAALGDHARAAKTFARVPAEFPDSRYAAECALHGGIEYLAANDPASALELLGSQAAGTSARS
jgi:tetratricopeptide (TPR) repeat protein